jgi:hypothetical protein
MGAFGSVVTFLASASSLACAISFAAFRALAAEARTAVAVSAVAALMMAACSGVMDAVARAALTWCQFLLPLSSSVPGDPDVAVEAREAGGAFSAAKGGGLLKAGAASAASARAEGGHLVAATTAFSLMEAATFLALSNAVSPSPDDDEVVVAEADRDGGGRSVAFAVEAADPAP